LLLLAAAWFGSDPRAGELAAEFVDRAGLPDADPLEIARAMLPAGSEPEPGLLEAQRTVGLKAVEIERAAYVKAERGRLSAAMGSVYFDAASGRDAVFHPAAPTGEPVGGEAGPEDGDHGRIPGADPGDGPEGAGGPDRAADGRTGEGTREATDETLDDGAGGPSGQGKGRRTDRETGQGTGPGTGLEDSFAGGSGGGAEARPDASRRPRPGRVRGAADAPPDPDELSLDELALLPTLVKRVERLGTSSWLPFYPVAAGVKQRLGLLARLHRKLAGAIPCGADEFAELLDGHDRWVRSHVSAGPRIIMPG
jgi:hypothetical protein